MNKNRFPIYLISILFFLISSAIFAEGQSPLISAPLSEATGQMRNDKQLQIQLQERELQLQQQILEIKQRLLELQNHTKPSSQIGQLLDN